MFLFEVPLSCLQGRMASISLRDVYESIEEAEKEEREEYMLCRQKEILGEETTHPTCITILVTALG